MSDSVQSTVLASILHAVQEEIQLQMANHIESLTEGPALTTEKPSDHTALYRISGWALKSAIDYRTKYKTVKSEDELQLLKALKRSQVSKITIPAGAQYLDRGGLTFMKPEFLPWICEIEESIKNFLNQRGYQKYGKHIFRVSECMYLLNTYTHILCIHSGYKG